MRGTGEPRRNAPQGSPFTGPEECQGLMEGPEGGLQDKNNSILEEHNPFRHVEAMSEQFISEAQGEIWMSILQKKYMQLF